MIGQTLGPYEIVAKLGEGGMGQVYRARDTKLNRDVAIKVLPDGFAGDPERLARFRLEAPYLDHFESAGIVQDLNGAEALGSFNLSPPQSPQSQPAPPAPGAH